MHPSNATVVDFRDMYERLATQGRLLNTLTSQLYPQSSSLSAPHTAQVCFPGPRMRRGRRGSQDTGDVFAGEGAGVKPCRSPDLAGGVEIRASQERHL
jgi:hypothetical protein